MFLPAVCREKPHLLNSKGVPTVVQRAGLFGDGSLEQSLWSCLLNKEALCNTGRRSVLFDNNCFSRAVFCSLTHSAFKVGRNIGLLHFGNFIAHVKHIGYIVHTGTTTGAEIGIDAAAIADLREQDRLARRLFERRRRSGCRRGTGNHGTGAVDYVTDGELKPRRRSGLQRKR